MDNTEIITLPDGIRVEVDIPEGRRAVSTVGDLATKGWNELEGFVKRLSGPFLNVYRDLSKESAVSEIQIDIGLSFEAGGSIFVVKANGSASLRVSITLKPSTVVVPPG